MVRFALLTAPYAGSGLFSGTGILPATFLKTVPLRYHSGSQIQIGGMGAIDGLPAVPALRHCWTSQKCNPIPTELLRVPPDERVVILSPFHSELEDWKSWVHSKHTQLQTFNGMAHQAPDPGWS